MIWLQRERVIRKQTLAALDIVVAWLDWFRFFLLPGAIVALIGDLSVARNPGLRWMSATDQCHGFLPG